MKRSGLTDLLSEGQLIRRPDLFLCVPFFICSRGLS